jgi:hypothetical protein
MHPGLSKGPQLDIWYVDHWSLDMRILAQTIRKYFGGLASLPYRNCPRSTFLVGSRQASRRSHAARDRGSPT